MDRCKLFSIRSKDNGATPQTPFARPTFKNYVALRFELLVALRYQLTVHVFSLYRT